MMTAAQWLSDFAEAMAFGNGEDLAQAFIEGGFWRDYLAFGWTLQTIEGRPAIAAFINSTGAQTGVSNPVFEGAADATEGFFEFETMLGRGKGYIRLKNGLCQSLLTTLEELKGFEEPLGKRRRPYLDMTTKESARASSDSSPYVLIVGGGQSGLALGARLTMLGVPYLIVDKHPRVGDQWRSRYKSLTLHDPVWYDHMPYMAFPEFWPVFTPKDKMGDWLEGYAKALDLTVWTKTECTNAHFDETTETWVVDLLKDGQKVELNPTHLIMAVGTSGFPKIPNFEGQERFKGPQMHSSAFKGGEDRSGQRAVIVGSNNSAHDIAADLAQQGAYPVMIQRSSTLVVRQSVFCDRLLGALYSEAAIKQGITTEKADLLAAATPLRLLEVNQKKLWDDIQVQEAPFYQKLTEAGFQLDFAEDGTGLGMKYRRTASGYYIDVGASEMVVDGQIGVRSGVTVAHLTHEGVVLNTGELLPADIIVYATGFGSMEDWVTRLINPQTAEKIGTCWGYGSGTKGDPGPWEGELRNMWKPTAQTGLWFMGGNLSQGRFYSKYLALQLKARFEDLPFRIQNH